MNNAARQALSEIIAKYGTEVCSDSRRCEGLLRDKAGAYRREISILINALEERVPLDLLAGNAVPRELLFTRLAKRLEDNLALTEDAAVWAVESWALALDLVTDRELAERENKRTKNQDLNPGNKTPDYNQNLPGKPTPATSNQPPVFAPFPDRAPQIDISLGTQSAQIPVPVAPAGQTMPQTGAGSQSPTVPIRSKKRSWKTRGCFIGCVLLLILLGVLAVGVPYSINVMREATRQSQQPPIPSQ